MNDNQPDMSNVPFYKWPSIESFRSVAHNCSALGRMRYRGKVKLHGTNAAITFADGVVQAQSRSRIITPDDDNIGFAKWVSEQDFGGIEDMTIFGEWIGPGVQRGVACSKIERRAFCVFAIRIGADYITDPNTLSTVIPEHQDIFVLPWHSDAFEIDFFFPNVDLIASLNAEVAEVEQSDPWIKDVFGVDGTGEGLVYFPVDSAGVGRTLSTDDLEPNYLGRRVFKAKGEAHRVNGHKEAVEIKAAVLEGVPEFVEFAVTKARLEQGVSEVCQGTPLIQKTGDFVKWILHDIKKECRDEIAALNCPEGKALGPCGARAVQWFKAQAA